MAGYIKIGDIKGESTKDADTFNFKFDTPDASGDSKHENWSDLISVGQSTVKPGASGDFSSGGTGPETTDILPTEELSMGYTEIEWTY